MVNQYPLIINENTLYNTNNIECIRLLTYTDNNQMQLKWEFKFKSKTHSVTQTVDDPAKINTIKNYIDNNGIDTFVQTLTAFGSCAYLDQFIPNIDAILSPDVSAYPIKTHQLSDIIVDGCQISGNSIEYIKVMFIRENCLRVIIKTNKKTYSYDFNIPSDTNIPDNFIKALLDLYAHFPGLFNIKHEIQNILANGSASPRQ